MNAPGIGRLIMVVGMVLMAGCAVRPPEAPQTMNTVAIADWAVPAAPESWRLNGRASLQWRDEGATAGIVWEQSGQRYRIDLRGALGAGSLRLIGRPEGVELSTAAGDRYLADNARELVRATTGYDLPIEFLRWWVTGRAVPWLEGQVIIDDQSRAREIIQDGWRVALSDYQAVDGDWLPHRLSIDGNQASVRLQVRRWQVMP